MNKNGITKSEINNIPRIEIEKKKKNQNQKTNQTNNTSLLLPFALGPMSCTTVTAKNSNAHENAK
jgi:hypothetical protein